jgi:hypothetical protein
MATYSNHFTAALAQEHLDDLRHEAEITQLRRSARRQPRPRTTRRRPTWWTAVTARAA